MTGKSSRQFWLAALAATLAVVLLATAGAAAAGSLDDIRVRGSLIVGTKADYKPFGWRDEGGAVVGFEPDLALEVATALGVKPELVPVVASNRITLLTDGKLDLVIATMNDTPERRKQVDFVEPSYYASGVNVLAPKSAHLRIWQQLRGQPVCTIKGAFYVGELQDRYGPELRLFKDTGEVYPALKRGDCAAFAYDDAAIIGQLQSADWQDFEMPLRSILVQPWGIAVRHGETQFAAMLGDRVKTWHRTGRIQALEKTWNIPPSVFAEEMHRRYLDGE
jgi:polar amino acid transport system substrate-binding protein